MNPTTTSYVHDGLGRETRVARSGISTIGYDYDGLGRMVRISRANDADTVLAYDPLARLETMEHLNHVAYGFAYNPASQLVTRTVSNNSFVWDEHVVVNRNYGVNNLNQYTSAGPASFSYDDNGNLTGDGTNIYAYDPENRLKWVIRGGVSRHLRYDGRGRLLRRWGMGLGTVEGLYDGDALIAEYTGNGTLYRRYIHGAGIDDPLVVDRLGEPALRRYLHADERGSIVGQSGAGGFIASPNTYDEWGIPGASNIGRFQYTGQQYLEAIGLYYYKARFYSPTLGRFMQTDSIGYEDGMNMYAYVGNDPVNGIDPTGTCATGTRAIGRDGETLNSPQCRTALGLERGSPEAQGQKAPRQFYNEHTSAGGNGGGNGPTGIDVIDDGLEILSHVPEDIKEFFEAPLENSEDVLAAFPAGRAATGTRAAIVQSLDTPTARRAAQSLRAPRIEQGRRTRALTLDRRHQDRAEYEFTRDVRGMNQRIEDRSRWQRFLDGLNSIAEDWLGW